MTAARTCGDCRLCCKTMKVEALNKPADVWCAHAGAGGCSIYPSRPGACAGFVCMWIDAGEHPERRDLLPDDLRPDKLHAVLTPTTDGRGVVVHVDPAYPLAHRQGKLAALIERFAVSSIPVHVTIGKRRLYEYHPLRRIDR